MPDTMLTYAEQPLAKPGLDLIAIHTAADNEVNEIYRLNANIGDGLMVLLQLAKGICNDPDDLAKLRFVIDALRDINDDLIDANDRLTNAIDPLNPTVLDDGSV